MGVECRVAMEMEVAASAHRLPKEASISEVNSTPETNAFPRSPFLDHSCRKLVQECGGVLELVRRERSKNLLQDLVGGRLILGQERASLCCERKLHGSTVGCGFCTAYQSPTDQTIDSFAGCRITDRKEIGDVTNAPSVGSGHKLQHTKLRRSYPVLRGFLQLLLHPLVDSGGEDPDAS